MGVHSSHTLLHIKVVHKLYTYKVDIESGSECFTHRARVRARVRVMARVGLGLRQVLG